MVPRVRRSLVAAWAIIVVPAAVLTPARYQSGTLPGLPPLAVGGGEVLIELLIDRQGSAGPVVPLRTTPPFTDLVTEAVRTWRFRPAAENGPIDSTVLIAALYRPPSINAPTHGELPRDVGVPAPGTPYPLSTAMPAYPPMALMGGVVLVEARVSDRGAVADAIVLRSAPPFDGPALDAARRWRFRPAQRRGTAVRSTVYIVFGFPAPVS